MLRSQIKTDAGPVPVTCVNTVIVGAGAAGMNAAVQLIRLWRRRGVPDPHERLLVVTGGLALGASRMSGSDKQTYYKMGTSPRVPDTAEDFARALTAAGCCHGDNALVEANCSLRAFYNLVDAGVPFPHSPCGAYVGYKTDNDPHERATSAGPKTSRFMSDCLEAEGRRMGLRIVDRHPVARFVTAGQGAGKRIVAMVCFDPSRAPADELALSVFVAENWILAAGGPGGIYQTTVYPRGQVGIHGPAFEAGLEARNLTESQFGLAAVKFRWNVSGTYMQAIPRIFSTDQAGGEKRDFLTEYFDDAVTMATNIFLKGYQWPFDAQRITGRQSSLIDAAVHQETVVRGRRVWMDFLRNPAGGEGRDDFSINAIDALAPEAQDYLRKTGALQATPMHRLRHMNPPAIEIFAEAGIDLAAEPLEIALCAQHMNGGFAVNKWWESNIAQTFVIGEMAGTHGVKRPGGAALNAGQVGAMRAAEYIANVYAPDEPDGEAAAPAVAAGLAALQAELRALRQKAATAPSTCEEELEQIRRRMTRHGAHLRSRAGAASALAEAKAQYDRLRADGMRLPAAGGLAAAAAVLQQCLTHLAVLKAICAMFDRGAGSRGSHCILDEDGIEMHPALIDPATGRPYRFRPENEALREEILCVKYNPAAADLFDVRVIPPRPIPDRQIAFEPAWAEFRSGAIYRA